MGADQCDSPRCTGRATTTSTSIASTSRCPPTRPSWPGAISDRHFGVGGDGLILICPSDGGRRPDADVQRRRLRGGDVRQRHPLRGQVRLRPRHLPQARRCGSRPAAACSRWTWRSPTARSAACASTWASRSSSRREIPTTLPGNPAFAGSPAADVELDVGGRRLRGDVRLDGQSALRHVRRRADRRLGARRRAAGRDRSAFPQARQRRVRRRCSRPARCGCGCGSAARGETLACGTGACAVCVAGALTGRTDRKILAHLPGGDLELRVGRRQPRLHDRPGGGSVLAASGSESG